MSLNTVFCSAGRFVVLLLSIGLLNGCAGTSPTTPPVDTSISDSDLAQVTTTVESYGDIELPIEMTLVPKRSMAMRTDSFQGGIHVYSGKVEITSLRDYIIASMRNHKWKLVGEASYNGSMLAFTKPNKTCMVVLKGGSMMGKTEASLYVTVDVAAASRLNPFGEPIKQ
ncbi:MAG: hypothetical protein JRC87_05905 [Deltaproteobacteria bacterium]|nr:hypothetical protein [Deltaproteobacteria bacterium]MBW2659122.1 hypothetical protein [Deltaproteobacteria bacterium]